MAQIQNYIFNRKKLNKIVEEIKKESIPNYEQSITLIKKWQKAFQVKELGKIKEAAVPWRFLDQFFNGASRKCYIKGVSND